MEFVVSLLACATLMFTLLIMTAKEKVEDSYRDVGNGIFLQEREKYSMLRICNFAA